MLPSPVVLQLVGGKLPSIIYGTKTNYLHTRENKNGELISRVPTYFSYMNIISHRMKPRTRQAHTSSKYTSPYPYPSITL
ncbi:hypothetical protein ACHAXN_008089, partial [Cyclotella atomus]